MKLLQALILSAPVLIMGCGRGDGVIAGTVLLQGTPPPERKITFDAASTRLQTTNHVTTRHYVLGSNAGLANVLVYVKGDLSDVPFHARTNQVSLDIQRAVYEPYVSAVQTNQLVQIRNHDPILHSAHITPPAGNTNKSYHLALAMKAQPHSLAFAAATVNPRPARESWRERILRWLRLKPAPKPKAGGSTSPFIRFKCDVHPWEYGYVAVLEHAFFAVTGPEGTFELPPLPAGRYTLEVVHLKAGAKTQEVTVGPGERKRVTLVMKVPAATP